jgi:2-polyprenyl-3-methyl-5-hydroxy-6-metoxy-1,4-benzoquinol methylase
MTRDLACVACNLCGSLSYRRVLEKGDAGGNPQRALVRCRTCGLVYVNPRLPGSEIERQYTDRAAQSFFLDSLYLPRKDRFRPFFAELLAEAEARGANGPPGRLLDVGCCAGVLLDEARRRGWSVEGLEPSGPAVEHARSAYGVPVQQTTVREAELPEGRYDLITLVECLEHLADPRADLARLARAVAPGGLVLITTPNWNTLARLVSGARWDAIVPTGHLYYFNRSTLTALLAATGLSVIAVRTRGLSWVNRRPRLRRLVERLGLGETLIAWAVRPMAPPPAAAAATAAARRTPGSPAAVP